MKRFWEVILNKVMVPLLDDIQSLSRVMYFSKLTTARSQQNGVSLICPADCVTGVSIILTHIKTPGTCHLLYDYESFMPRIA
jgi:hypothetical protein